MGTARQSLYRMGAMGDRVAAMRKEMELAIEQASDSVHNSVEWWDDFYTEGGKTLIENLLDRLERIAARYAEDLTR
jgi:hypothetical protein